MFKITIPTANWAQARAYINRIECNLLLAANVAREQEGAFPSSDGTEVTVFVSTPERLVQLTQQLYLEEYI